MADPKEFINPDGTLPPKYNVFRDSIDKASTKYRLPKELLYGLLQKESSGRVDLTGDDGHGQGPFQIDDRFHQPFLAQSNNGRDVPKATEYAAKMLRHYIDLYNGDVRKGVAAYNAGPGGVNRAVRHGEDPDKYTKGGNYASTVLGMADQFRPAVSPPEVNETSPSPAPSEFQPLAPEAPVPPDMPAEGIATGEPATPGRPEAPPQGDIGRLSTALPPEVAGAAYRSLPESGVNPAPAAEDHETVERPAAPPLPTDTAVKEPEAPTPDAAPAAQAALPPEPKITPREAYDLSRDAIPSYQPPAAEATVDPGTYNTTPYPELPEQDFAGRLKSAAQESDRRKDVNLLARAVGGIGASLGGVKQDEGFEKALDEQAGGPLRDVQRDMGLDKLARAQREAQALRDPSSRQNRAYQDLIIGNLPQVARRIGVDRIRQMTRADMEGALGSVAKLLPVFNTARHQEQTEQMTGQHLVNADRVALMKALAGDDKGTNLRNAIGTIQKYADKTQFYRDIATHLEGIDSVLKTAGAANGLVPNDISPGFWQKLASRYAKGLDSQFTPAETEILRSEFIQLKQQLRHPVAGANLSNFEAAEWDSVAGDGLLSSPGAMWLWVNSVRKDMQRALKSQDTLYRGLADAAQPGLWNTVVNNPGVITSSSPVFNQPDYHTPDTIPPKATKQASPAVNPPGNKAQQDIQPVIKDGKVLLWSPPDEKGQRKPVKAPAANLQKLTTKGYTLRGE